MQARGQKAQARRVWTYSTVVGMQRQGKRFFGHALPCPSVPFDTDNVNVLVELRRELKLTSYRTSLTLVHCPFWTRTWMHDVADAVREDSVVHLCMSLCMTGKSEQVTCWKEVDHIAIALPPTPLYSEGSMANQAASCCASSPGPGAPPSKSEISNKETSLCLVMSANELLPCSSSETLSVSHKE